MHTLLLVDHDRQASTALAQHLVQNGFKVSITHDGREALSVLQREGFDLVITEIRLPGLENYAILSWLTINRPESKVIMLTSGGDYRIDSPTAIRMGALFCLEKPVSPSHLIDTVHEALNETGFSGTISKITLADYLQLCIYTTATRTFEIIKGSRIGMIIVQEGVITYAQCGDLSGEQAFYEILSWDGGRINEVRLPQAPMGNITQESNFLLLEATRIHDENKRDSSLAADKETIQGTPPGSPALADEPAAGAREASAPEQPSPLLLMALQKSLRIQGFGIFDAHDHVLGKSEDAGQILDMAPSYFLDLCQSLWEDGESGSLRYLIINTRGGGRYLLFRQGIHRVVVGMKSGARPEDLLKEISRSTAEEAR